MWATGGALAFTLALSVYLMIVVMVNGLGVYWASPLERVQLQGEGGQPGDVLLGERVERENDAHRETQRVKYHVGNREFGPAFRWIDEGDIQEVTLPEDALKLDRVSNLNYIGFLKELKTPGLELPDSEDSHSRLSTALSAARYKRQQEIGPIEDEESVLARELNDRVKYAVVKAEYQRKQLLRAGTSPQSAEIAAIDGELAKLRSREEELKAESHSLTLKRNKLETALRENAAVFVDASGHESVIPLIDIIRFTNPNRMGVAAKIQHYVVKVWELLWDNPREANQDGGVFPAIMGTVLMVFLMAITCFPLGVLAGIYLGEYAKEGPLVRVVRIAVNNLAGIPSIVYGIFGLGFFVYLCGGTLDRWLFPEMVDNGQMVFGQGCILWASLTLGLLTVPVVIVSTEEALRQIPRGIKEGSYALGATKFQTLCRVLVPMASPGMMTGFILAMARAAGEVAPLMLTGATKIAPVPMSENFPYFHLDRQFMHLGFHIYDISCKSPNVEATKPLVYVTTLLLLLIVVTMTSLAIWMRNRMRSRYQSRSI